MERQYRTGDETVVEIPLANDANSLFWNVRHFLEANGASGPVNGRADVESMAVDVDREMGSVLIDGDLGVDFGMAMASWIGAVICVSDYGGFVCHSHHVSWTCICHSYRRVASIDVLKFAHHLHRPCVDASGVFGSFLTTV